ncbi:hypothetical protein CEXT_246511 [Caerostris extrusa]|uniref:Uncharacterized protein n=1 Tax=Caerostris extrusa TaxID=172846 RepID=A0AAV4XEV0_CAEEX|nr:hypothetical protein CEXT_246511 [Caerostris extrusa]
MRRIFHNLVSMATGISLPLWELLPDDDSVTEKEGGREKVMVRWLSSMKYFPSFFHPSTRFRQGIKGWISSGVNWSFSFSLSTSSRRKKLLRFWVFFGEGRGVRISLKKCRRSCCVWERSRQRYVLCKYLLFFRQFCQPCSYLR